MVFPTKTKKPAKPTQAWMHTHVVDPEWRGQGAPSGPGPGNETVAGAVGDALDAALEIITKDHKEIAEVATDANKGARSAGKGLNLEAKHLADSIEILVTSALSWNDINIHNDVSIPADQVVDELWETMPGETQEALFAHIEHRIRISMSRSIASFLRSLTIVDDLVQHVPDVNWEDIMQASLYEKSAVPEENRDIAIRADEIRRLTPALRRELAEHLDLEPNTFDQVVGAAR